MQGMRLSRIGVKEKQLMSAQEMKRQCAVFAAPPRAFANTFSSFFLASYVHMSARGAPRRAAIGSRSRSRSRSQLRDVRVQLKIAVVTMPALTGVQTTGHVAVPVVSRAQRRH